jgi:orotidine-5'-phosphate decarboxylase
LRRDHFIFALDVENFHKVQEIVKKLGESVSFYKVGLRLFTREGPPVVQWLKKRGLKVFLDLKFHDIPNTVSQAVESAVALGVDFMTVHGMGGLEMMEAAVRAARLSARRFKKKRPKIFAVTVLTSLTHLRPLGISSSIPRQVLRLADLAKRSGVDGIVCSPLEVKKVKKRVGRSLLILTPGVRLEKGSDDQKRTATPAEAIQDGADYIVMGRPILKAPHPQELIRQILRSVS